MNYILTVLAITFVSSSGVPVSHSTTSTFATQQACESAAMNITQQFDYKDKKPTTIYITSCDGVGTPE